MSDWKSVLREFKKELPSKQEQNNGHKPENHTKPKAVVTGNSRPRKVGNLEVRGRPVGRQARHVEPVVKMTAKPAHPPRPREVQRVSNPPVQKSPPIPAKVAPPRPNGIPERLLGARCQNLTRRSYYMTPEPWVSAGARTQHSAVPGNRTMDIVIGFDFGTSFTKAAVGLKDQIFPVSWEGLSATPERHLLPSEYSEINDGSCHIGQAPTVTFEQLHQKLKQPLINPAVSSACITEASVFVALVLRYIRAWVYQVHGGKIGTSQIRWLLNIGAPSNGLETGRLEAAYQKLGSMAWRLSLGEGDITLAKAQETLSNLNSNPSPQDLFDLNVLPEFVAQIAGYVQSAQRRRGLHALIDVGGGTLDVVTFIVHQREDEDLFPFLVPEIRVLGTQMLNQNRLVDASGYDVAQLPDELAPVLEAEEYARACGLPEQHVRTRDGVLWDAIRDTVKGVFYKTRQKRYRLSDAWTEGIPTFLTGGGSKVDGYGKSIKVAGESLTRAVNLMPLPLHPRLADFQGGSDDYQRISVACGLAQDAFSIGKIVPAKDVEDDVAPRGSTVERPDRDELYSH